jgi:hypothetical protein
MRLKHVLAATAILTNCALSTLNVAVADDQKKVMVNGKLLEIYSGSPPILVLGNKVILRPPEITAYLNVEGIYDGDERTFVLVSEGTGGTACPGDFAIVEMRGATATVSDTFGTCSDVAKAEVKGDALIVTIPKFDGTGEDVTIFRGGQLTTTEKIYSEDGEGPAQAPGGNLALFLANKDIASAMGLKAFVNALRRIMSHDDFKEIRLMALSGPGTNFTMHEGLAVAGACERHNCGDHRFSVAVDQAGRAWAALYNESKERFFGNPDPSILAQFRQ